MYISFFLAKNNMKKKKSDVAVVTFLIILSTMLLYISTSVLGNVNEVIDKAKNACNTADHTYFTGDKGAELAEEIWNHTWNNRQELYNQFIPCSCHRKDRCVQETST